MKVLRSLTAEEWERTPQRTRYDDSEYLEIINYVLNEGGGVGAAIELDPGAKPATVRLRLDRALVKVLGPGVRRLSALPMDRTNPTLFRFALRDPILRAGGDPRTGTFRKDPREWSATRIAHVLKTQGLTHAEAIEKYDAQIGAAESSSNGVSATPATRERVSAGAR